MKKYINKILKGIDNLFKPKPRFNRFGRPYKNRGGSEEQTSITNINTCIDSMNYNIMNL